MKNFRMLIPLSLFLLISSCFYSPPAFAQDGDTDDGNNYVQVDQTFHSFMIVTADRFPAEQPLVITMNTVGIPSKMNFTCTRAFMNSQDLKSQIHARYKLAERYRFVYNKQFEIQYYRNSC